MPPRDSRKASHLRHNWTAQIRKLQKIVIRMGGKRVSQTNPQAFTDSFSAEAGEKFITAVCKPWI
jgi:hypothetical protein